MDLLCHFIEVKKPPGTVRMIVATLLAIFLLSTAYCQEKHSILVHDDKHCPPWLYYNDTVDQCSCYQSSSRDVECRENEREALLRFDRCMTYEEGSGTFVGICQYFIIDHFLENITERHYINIPDSVQDLNEYMCKPLNRKGKICRECIDGLVQQSLQWDTSVPTALVTGMEYLSIYFSSLSLLPYSIWPFLSFESV